MGEACRDLEKRLSDQYWRLNSLYQIKNKEGQMVPFRFNAHQERLYRDMHYLNLILKARQLGMTTLIDLMFLDTCLFNSNKNAGIIAHHKDDAQKIFEEKVLIPYRNMDENFREVIATETESKHELQFVNNSYIRVGTSMRSATLQYLHISEYGITCARFPEKAQEIRTGALNTLHAGQIAFIESTSKGRIGHFPELWDQAYDLHKRMCKLTMLDWRIFFFPWFEEPEYQLNPVNVVFGARDLEYFEELAARHNIHLSERQKAWYVKKRETLGPAIKQEYPSTPEEAWEGGGILLNWNARYHEMEDGPFPPPDNWPIFAGFDYGFGRPFSYGWYTQDFDGVIYRIREWYGWSGNPNEGIRLSPAEIAQGVKKREQQWGIWGRVEYRVAGGDVFTRTVNQKTGEYGPTINEMFIEVDSGLAFIRADDKHRKRCVAQCHNRLRLDFEDGKLVGGPYFRVYKKACPQFLRTVPGIPCDPNDPEDAWTDAEDHAFDEFKYVLMSRPMAPKKPEPPKPPAQRIIDHVEQGPVDTLDTPFLPEEGEGLFGTEGW